ncbi:hypothetical protein PV797_08785 [Clostridiaceae bacterium M8S5]|nr:hypothetical protein PV797_08785 [Clostridiaceae bacterium M8S5]
MKTKTLILILLITLVVGGCKDSSKDSTKDLNKDSTNKTINEPIDNASKNSIKSEGLKLDYSKGYESKAKVQFKRLEAMKSFYKKAKNLDLKVHVELLDKEEWTKKYKDVPYGMPFVMLEETPTVVLPATEDGIIVKNALVYKDNVPSDIKKTLSEIGFTYEEAVKLFPDLIGLHEVGHSLTVENGNTNLNSWFNEFMATYYAYAYLVKEEPKYAKLWKANASITYLDGSKPKYTALKDFDEKYSQIQPDNYDWYQKQFTLLAVRVYDSMGLDFIDKVKDVFKDDVVDSDETFNKLHTISPIFDQWASEMKNKFK